VATSIRFSSAVLKSHTQQYISTDTSCMCLRPLGRATTNSTSLQQAEVRSWGVLSVKSAESVLVGFGCEVEEFSARGFWVCSSPELSRFLISVRFRKWDWVKYYDMNKGRTIVATMYVSILSTVLKHTLILRRTIQSFLYTYIGLHAQYGKFLSDFYQTWIS